MNTTKNYGFKVIDTKMKEAYFDVRPVLTEKAVLDNCYKVWNMMNIIAVNNIGIQHVKLAS